MSARLAAGGVCGVCTKSEDNVNTPDHASDSQINRLIAESEPEAPHVCTQAPCFHRSHIAPSKPPSVADHPLAAWIFKTYKRDTAIIAKADAYKIGNELNRLQDRVDELEQRLGIPKYRTDGHGPFEPPSLVRVPAYDESLESEE